MGGKGWEVTNREFIFGNFQEKKKSKHVSGMSGENPSLEGMWLVAVKKGLRHLHANY